jgi:hypothetical protein
MDIEQGIKSPFSDPKWFERTALGGVISLVPILNFAAQGYMLDYTRAVAYNQQAPLPDWGDLGRYFVRGLLSALAGFLLALPGIILMVIGFIPLIGGLIAGEDFTVIAGASTMCIFFAIALIYFFVLSIFWGAAFTNYAMSEEFGAFFDFSRIKAKIGSGSNYFGAWGLSLLVYFVAGSLTGVLQMPLSFIPFLGALAGSLITVYVMFCAQLVAQHYYGQYAATAYADELQPVAAPQGE